MARGFRRRPAVSHKKESGGPIASPHAGVPRQRVLQRGDAAPAGLRRAAREPAAEAGRGRGHRLPQALRGQGARPKVDVRAPPKARVLPQLSLYLARRRVARV